MTTKEILDKALEIYKNTQNCGVKTLKDATERCPNCKNQKLCDGFRLILQWHYGRNDE